VGHARAGSSPAFGTIIDYTAFDPIKLILSIDPKNDSKDQINEIKKMPNLRRKKAGDTEMERNPDQNSRLFF